MIRYLISACFILLAVNLNAQSTVRGKVRDGSTADPVFGAYVIEKGSNNGSSTDFNGEFSLKIGSFPTTLVVTFIGYEKKEVVLSSGDRIVNVDLNPTQILIEEAEIVGERISEKQKQAPLTVESMDVIAIKDAPSGNFYEGLGNLKGVDLTSASLGFKIINTRGFNSTSPVRSLQLIDGVDNQSPGLNFSLGNFLGASDLDVKNVDIVAGASSAFYGPGAFNGVVNMTTKNPFIYPGLSISMKMGERSLFEHAFRFAEAIQNKDGQDVFAYKLNFYSFRARDWEAENYEPIDGVIFGKENPGRYDAVNVYGDEYYPANDFSTSSPWNFKGIGAFFRTGYQESDVVNYNTKNLKSNLAFHFRTDPEAGFDSPELSYAFNIGNGTTIYQGDNRFSLRDIVFYQQKIEYSKFDKFFIRAYMTKEDAGNSYDPYATSLALLEEARDPNDWAQVYVKYWNDSINNRLENLGYPELEWDPEAGAFTFNNDSLESWTSFYNDSLFYWHGLVEGWTNNGNANLPGVNDLGYYSPGTDEFKEAFRRITGAKNNEDENGTRFYDKSALYHVHGEYIFKPTFLDRITVGANTRLYRPNSDGTIFVDTADVQIKNSEWGGYIGLREKFIEDKIIANATLRIDKNQNFDMIITPALSIVVQPKPNNYFRASFSSALRNPTLSDQYLFLDVGRAILSGNLHGADSLITLESFSDYRATLDPDTVRYFDIDPIRPEQVKTFEVGYRTTLWNSLYVDAGYYFSSYTHFIGFNIGIDAEFGTNGLPTDIQVYRYSANSKNEVRTQGFAIGLNYYVNDKIGISGNYSWNQLLKADPNDPIIPAFNTPEHKFNLSFTGRNMKSGLGEGKNTWGYGVNYKWVQGFVFEGSPQFTGFVPSYDLIDAQVNYRIDAISSTFKLGASNLLNNQQFQTYGGPRIGRLGYFSILYELSRN